MENKVKKLRIHGDNIVECETAIQIMSESLGAKICKIISGPAYAPVYEIISSKEERFDVQIFPGYGRWGFDIIKYLSLRGAPLREATDVIITELKNINGKPYEHPLMAMEFCGALPAGNNAWQRSGRALSLAYANIPYLYFAELGGVELDENRNVKASRFPNPIIPFAYLELGNDEKSLALPIYKPSPSITKELFGTFKDCFGYKDSLPLINGLLTNTYKKGLKDILEAKAIHLVEILSANRKRQGILTPEEWKKLYLLPKDKKMAWLLNKKMKWKKKLGIKTVTSTFKKILSIISRMSAAPGCTDIPFCLIDKNTRPVLSKIFEKIYKKRISGDFLGWLGSKEKPLVIVFVAGFKPHGDDSRPDRGLAPLSKMVLGRDGYDLLSIVYGPAPRISIKQLNENPEKLIRGNGLWESIFNLSDAVLADTPTAVGLKFDFLIKKAAAGTIEVKDMLLPAASIEPKFSEHDVDSVLHLLFSKRESDGIFESMCNPPGGDWSGISIVNFDNGHEFRWTSLPRVSGEDTKRPDHLIQFKLNNSLLAIESKEDSKDLETGIGPRLILYIKKLLKSVPTAFRIKRDGDWGELCRFKFDLDHKLLSGSAFKYKSPEDLSDTFKRGNTNFSIGIEFQRPTVPTIVHIIAEKKNEIFLKKFLGLQEGLGDMISIKTYTC
jgi:hypothetical protein